MNSDMSLTLNALPVRDSGKTNRNTVESQPAAPPKGTDPLAGNTPVEEAARSERPEVVSVNVPEDELKGAVSQMQDFAQMLNRELQFDVDEDLGRTVVRVLDKDTGDLIRQIPSDEILAMAKHMKELREAELAGVETSSQREAPVGLLMKTQA